MKNNVLTLPHTVIGEINITVADIDTCAKGHTICNSVIQLSVLRHFLIYTGTYTHTLFTVEIRRL